MLYDKIVALLARQLEIDPAQISRDTDILDDLGADSLDVVELVMTVEEEYGLMVTNEGLADVRTVGELTEFIESLL